MSDNVVTLIKAAYAAVEAVLPAASIGVALFLCDETTAGEDKIFYDLSAALFCSGVASMMAARHLLRRAADYGEDEDREALAPIIAQLSLYLDQQRAVLTG